MSKNEINNILNYWYACEFLTQQTSNHSQTVNKVNKEKEKIIKEESRVNKGKGRKLFPVYDYIVWDVQNENLNEILASEGNQLNRHIYDSITITVGQVMRDGCIERIAQNLGLADSTMISPDKSHSKIDFFSFEMSDAESYKQHTLVISPVVWALSNTYKNNIDLSEQMQLSQYRREIRDLENQLFGEYIDGKIMTRSDIVNIKEKLENTFIRPYFSDEYKDEIGINVFFRVEEKTEDKQEIENEAALRNSYYASDLSMIINKYKNNGNLNNIEEYITCMNRNDYENNRVDLINIHSDKKEQAFEVISDILDIRKYPMGKWPSDFNAAYMQQLAINLASNEDKGIFSVDGPPGTGKTTMLKEIVADNIVKKAMRLADYDIPDDLFTKNDFKDGDTENNAYTKYVPGWFSINDKEIINTGILVASNNNIAAENISKELPLCLSLNNSLNEVTEFFNPDDDYDDTYFKGAAEKLYKEKSWGLVSVPLGKKKNISDFYRNCLSGILREYFKNNDVISANLEKYAESRKNFKKQLDIVNAMKIEIEDYQAIYRKCCAKKKELDKKIIEKPDAIINIKRRNESLKEAIIVKQKQIDGMTEILRNKKKIIDDLKKSIISTEDNIKETECSISQLLKSAEDKENSVGFFARCFKTQKYKDTMLVVDNQKEEAKNLMGALEQSQSHKAKLEVNYEELLDDYKAYEEKKKELIGENKSYQYEIDNEDRNIRSLDNQICETENEYKELSAEFEQFGLMMKEKTNIVPFDFDYFDKIYFSEQEVSAEYHTYDPWIHDAYNKEREKLLMCALKLNRDFVISSKCCRQNLKTLVHFWGFDNNINISKRDKERIAPSLFNTLQLMVPVISTTFSSVGTMFRDVQQPGSLGTLIIDEAGQASPHTALGAMYRCNKTIVLGDPKQIEPIVTDDLAMLKQVFKNPDIEKYRSKDLSVQNFADKISRYGTYISTADEDIKEWVGCPMVVHRRCMSPMFDISNNLSYNGMMKQKTIMPDKEELDKCILSKSQWINVSGQEKGNKNHFVENQAKKICQMLEVAFEKNAEPDIFIISPFKSVVDSLEKYIDDYCSINEETTNINSEYILNSGIARIGTVHKFQGKEAKEVMFVLGCDNTKGCEGAIKWVNENLVNVAVTRAKYRLYIIGNGIAWEKSKWISKAKETLDTFAIREILKIKDGNMSEDEKERYLADLSKELPSVTSLCAYEEEDVSDEMECDISTKSLIDGLSKAFSSGNFTEEELHLFGFDDEEELNRLNRHVKENIIMGMRLYFLLDSVNMFENNPDMDVSCVSIPFCKALELEVKNDFKSGLMNIAPDFELKRRDEDGNPIRLIKGNDKDFTLGAIHKMLKSEMDKVIRKLQDTGDSVHNEKWWSVFNKKLNTCTHLRNLCCHNNIFSIDNQKNFIDNMFRETEVDNVKIKGVLFESVTGKKLAE